MLKRLLIAVLIFGIGFFVATQTPLEKYFLQYKSGSSSGNDGEENPFQVVSAEEAAKVAKENAVDIHVNESKPVRLEIPTLKVNANIYPVGLTPQGAMQTMDGPLDIAWYKFGSVPGKDGNAILAGHREWKGAIGNLLYLETMKIGKTMTITYDDGKKHTFELVSNKIYPLEKLPKSVMDLDGEKRVTVVTCAGKYDHINHRYPSRAVAVFKIVK